MNDQQLAAVRAKDGPVLVVAGAGTGKTRVIVERINLLLSHGTAPEHILALTFTEKAAQEMLDRVSEKLDDSYGVEIPIHTFNAFGQLLLREFAVEIGLSNNLTLVGDEGKVVFLREHLDALGLDYFAPVSRPDGQLTILADYFSELKQQLIVPSKYQAFADAMPDNDEAEKLNRKKHTELAHAYGVYINLMRRQNMIDYDDQIYLLVELLEKRANIAKELRARYRFIMVDEFQDTNPMQSRLIDLLADDHHNIMVVGDDDQSIYGWRGATLANIQEFTKRYPGAKQVTLIENFRSTREILDSCWQLIQHNNPNRLEYINKLDKRLQAKRGKGKAPTAYCFPRLELELGWISDDIAQRLKNGQQPGSIAVLARSRRGVARIHDMLGSAEIEHNVAGLGEDLYQQLPVLMMVDALRAVWEPANNTALYHTLASKLFKCSPASLSENAHRARYERRPLAEIIRETQDEELQKAIKQIDSWHEQVHDLSVRAMSYRILTDSGLKQVLYTAAAQNEVSAHEVFSLGQWFGSLIDFERITTTPSVHSYLENFEVLRAEGETLQDDTATLSLDLPSVMTIHKAKGLEWQTVYVIDCAASSFPYLGGGKSLKVPEQLKLVVEADARLAEERRLMYVAATRARDELIITYSERQNGSAVRKPSRFIEEMGITIVTPKASASHATVEQYLQTLVLDTAITLPPSMREGDHIVLSASQAEDYLVCPFNFYYKHVLCAPEQPSVQTKVGSLFHNLIQLINDAKKNHHAPPKKAELLIQLEADWPHGYNSLAQRERALNHGKTSFDKLYDRLLSEPIPVDVEAAFRIRIPSSHCVLKGRIDAVVPTEKGVEIHDYKTSSSVDTPEDAKNKTTASKQLTMYAVAWRIMHGEAPTHVSLDFVQTGQVGQVAKQARSLDSMEAKLADAAEAILAGNFPPGSQHDYCIHPPL